VNAARLFTLAGSIFAFLAVAAGAFGAHALRARLTPEGLAVFETGARYQMYHAVALFICAWLAMQGWRLAAPAGWLFIVGTIFFSGSLYLIALTGVTRFGMITPLGGLAFLAGWLCLVVCAWPRQGRVSDPPESDPPD
jgi:uncharacterized membrane protein YgdD (TMEM256/DUF423 family)